MTDKVGKIITANELEKELEKFANPDYEVIFDFPAMWATYEQYAGNITGRKASCGIESIDRSLGGIRPGEIMAVVAGTNVGKTSFWIPAALNTSQKQQDKLTVVFCTEPTEIEIFERYLQAELDLYTFEVEKMFLKENIVETRKHRERLMQKWGNIILVVKRIDIKEMPKFCGLLEEQYQKKVGFVIVDHVQNVRSVLQGQRANEIEYIMITMKQFINQSRLPGLITSHVARHDIKGEKREKELTLYSAKGSGEIENSAQIVFTLENAQDVPLNFDRYHEIGEGGTKKLLKLTPHKKKRGLAEPTYLLMDKKTAKIYEYIQQPIIDF